MDNEDLMAASMASLATSNVICSFTNPLVNILYNQVGAAIAVPRNHAKSLAGRNLII